ncbi:DnaJ-domain-containing protein, partial [Rhizoclosmatium globosum]
MQCYYESLGVDQTVDAAALKKAYRAKALELHPDKNYHRVEEATKLFAIVQHAYQVLSDPHERAWYDSHRDSILRGQDPDPSSSTATPSSSNATPTSKLYPFFSPSAYSGFDDKDPKSFYRVYGDLFEKLQNEELTAAETDPESIFQSDKTSVFEFEEFVFFGNGDEEYPRDFYQRFLTFSSTKSFRWHDKFRLSDGGDRAVRRAMETQNQKFRSNARRDFNETVRELTRYIQKRDPRYQAYLDTQKRDRELKVGKAKEKVKAEKEKMREKIETFEVAEWAKGPEVEVDEEEVLEELEELYCAACNKVFKSDRQWKNHEQSKKHQQNVEELRRQLLEEDELFTGGDSGDAFTGEDADELTEGEDI